MDHRLSRRGLFAGSAAALVAATISGCDEANGAGENATATSKPPGNTPMASWELRGGYLRAGLVALRPPRLVVFADGEAIADATHRSRLDDEELRELVDDLVSVLKTPDVTRRRSGVGSVKDAPDTHITVWSGTGMLSVSVEALDEHRVDNGYPEALYDARDRLGAVHKTVAATAQPYLNDRVRVVAEPTDRNASEAQPWPAELMLPSAGPDKVHRADLDGDGARVAMQKLTRDLDQRGAWPTYRTGDGSLLQASWRYLLPSE